MKKYKSPELEIVPIDAKDIIFASSEVPSGSDPIATEPGGGTCAEGNPT